MGKIVVTEFMSLDGVIEDPGGAEEYAHGGWSFKFDRGKEGDRYKFDELLASDAHLLGRVTYQGFAKAWPAMADNPFGEKMNAMHKYVVSSTMSAADATWEGSTVLSGQDLSAEIEQIKGEVAGDILLAGSGTLARSLAQHDLVDEYHLMVFPIVLGSGKRLFDGVPTTVLKLVDSTRVGPDGVFVLTYQPAREAAAG
ncbi:MAG TPA: dihydrofolate reductase family protein [Solirubrobacteraceae bacterium]|jgi:dihydrofolate reductase